MIVREKVCEFQPYIMHPPIHPQALRNSSTENDAVTIKSWKPTWLKNVKANKEFLGSFKDKSLGNLYGKHLYQPAILAGAGPSLKFNVDKLKERGSIPLISCLHNFHFLEDNGVPADYYVSLDAGDIVLEEVSEGGKRSEDEYWELTKDRTLLAFIGSPLELLKKWKGPLYVFNAPVPERDYEAQVSVIERFDCMVSTGGNVLGACMYIAKGFFGCSTSIFVGADFSFGYNDRFHSWDSKYDLDKGYCIPLVDVFGCTVKTWQSYANFKYWFDWVSLTIPGQYINCSEGGCLGSYREGNLWTVRQMSLEQCLKMFNIYKTLEGQAIDPANQTEIRLLF